MTVREFLKALQTEMAKLAEEVPLKDRHSVMEPHPLTMALAHLVSLLNEEKRPPEVRSMSVVKSSWSTVLKAGKKYGVFDKFAGDAATRKELESFLRGRP